MYNRNVYRDIWNVKKITQNSGWEEEVNFYSFNYAFNSFNSIDSNQKTALLTVSHSK